MPEPVSKLTALGSARPVRIAYLIALDEAPHGLLDAIFDESYSRWGGRRTLIIPTTQTGIDIRYLQWLRLFDPDIIYSYVSLDDSAVAYLNETICPAHLVDHTDRRYSSDPTDYEPALPWRGLNSLSLVPSLHGRQSSFWERLTNIQVIDQYFDRSESAFLRENFGFIRTSFRNSNRSEAAPEYYRCATLISESSLADPRLRKSSSAEYFTDEISILDAMTKPNQIFGLSELSDVFAPRLQTNIYASDMALTLVVGDSIDDRLLFWNGHHRSNRGLHEINSLHLYKEKTTDTKFMRALCDLIKRRGPVSQGHHHLSLCSCSLSTNDLREIGNALSDGGWISVQVLADRTHANCIPQFKDHERYIGYSYGYSFGSPPRTTADIDFTGSETRVPAATPWHMHESKPPASIRDGYWMIDLSISRAVDHSRYSNVAHNWVLPRRLRIQGAFKLTRDEQPFQYNANAVRTDRFGRLSVTGGSDSDFGTLSIPEDIDAFRYALCAEREWQPFKRETAIRGFSRYRYAEPSDKGRYLVGVLGHFEDLPTAFEFLMNSYWRDIVIHLGGISPEKNVSLQEELMATLRKRLASKSSMLTVASDEQWNQLARVALQFGRKVQRERRFVQYSQLKSKWEELVRKDLEETPHLSESDKEYYQKDFHLDQSIQALCGAQILFQGREWQCRKCFSRNWISIEQMSRSLQCEVCGNTKSAPVSGDWAFRLNRFVLEAYRDHGIEPLIWALWQLSQRARESFYFAPSMSLWDEYPETVPEPTAEIDALAVVDGTLYLCEVKAGSRLSSSEMDQLATVCARVRPDVLLLASMDGADLEPRIDGLGKRLSGVTEIEVIRFDPKQLHDGSMLPH